MWKYPIIFNNNSNNNNNSSSSSSNNGSRNNINNTSSSKINSSSNNIVIINSNNNNNNSSSNNKNNNKYKMNYTKLCPYLFVIDFDKTLAFYDSHREVDNSKSIYTRPFLYEFLDYIKSKNKNIIILWTAGTLQYINEKVLLLNLTQYFNHILHKSHCDQSKKETGVKKSYKYLKNKFPEYQHYRAILIDDYAVYNSYSNDDNVNLYNENYFKIITVKPFDHKDVYFYYGNKYSNSNTGDSTLLNLIIYLEETLFNFYNDSNDDQYTTQLYNLFLDSNGVLSISKCSNNNNKKDNIIIIYILTKSTI